MYFCTKAPSSLEWSSRGMASCVLRVLLAQETHGDVRNKLVRRCNAHYGLMLSLCQRRRAEEARKRGADILLLPELFASGYCVSEGAVRCGTRTGCGG
jgi:hypothetical protein